MIGTADGCVVNVSGLWQFGRSGSAHVCAFSEQLTVYVLCGVCCAPLCGVIMY